MRELRYKVHTPGYRVGEVTLVTTLLEASVYPAEALADLYFRRWQVEVYLRDLKIALKMDVLKCKTEDGVLKELAVFALVYNLVRSVACESAQGAGRGGGSGERDGRGAVAGGRRRGRGPVGDPDQPVAEGSRRAACQEAPPEAVSVDDKAEGDST